MATLLVLSCRQCGAETDEMDGAIMAGPRPRCRECGQSRLVPVDDLMRARSAAAGQGVDWSDADVAGLAGVCDCGGAFAADAPLRCETCRSTDVDRHVHGNAD